MYNDEKILTYSQFLSLICGWFDWRRKARDTSTGIHICVGIIIAGCHWNSWSCCISNWSWPKRGKKSYQERKRERERKRLDIVQKKGHNSFTLLLISVLLSLDANNLRFFAGWVGTVDEGRAFCCCICCRKGDSSLNDNDFFLSNRYLSLSSLDK